MRTFTLALVAALLLPLASPANAAITLASSRLVFEHGLKEQTLIVIHEGSEPVLLQAWLDGGTTAEGLVQVPFAVTPALVKMPMQHQQTLRVFYQGNGLAEDRESVVWLNVQEAPLAREDSNELQIAMRQRIKVFYRPKGLDGDPFAATAALKWTLSEDGRRLHLHNPSNYHVSMLRLAVEAAEPEEIVDRLMIGPQQEHSFELAGVLGKGAAVTLRSINDFGGQDDYRVTLNTGLAAQAEKVTSAPVAQKAAAQAPMEK